VTRLPPANGDDRVTLRTDECDAASDDAVADGGLLAADGRTGPAEPVPVYRTPVATDRTEEGRLREPSRGLVALSGLVAAVGRLL